MRRLLSVFVLCGVASGVMPSNATAQETSLQKSLEPLSRLGRALGLGWGDGYHACDRDCRLPTADLPPRSYVASHAMHPHYGQSNRQHWQAAAAANTPPLAYAPAYQARQQRPAGSGPQFAVPPSVLQELHSLEIDRQKNSPDKPSADLPLASPKEKRSPTQQGPKAAAPARLPAPVVPPTRPADVLPRRATPPIQVEPVQGGISKQLDTMLDSLRNDGPQSQQSTPIQPAPPSTQAETLDSILDGPLDDDLDLLLDEPGSPPPADEARDGDDLLLDDSDDLLLDDADDLLLDDQAIAPKFIREPTAEGPRRVPASERFAQQFERNRIARQESAPPRK